METKINAQTIIAEVMAARAIAPSRQDASKNCQFYELIRDCLGLGYAENSEASRYMLDIEYQESFSEWMHCGEETPRFVTFKTSARGTHRILNCRENLQRFADLVRKNAEAFGGGLVREEKQKPAVSYPSKSISLYKQLIEDKDYFAALQLAEEKLSPLFYFGTDGRAYMQVAPIPLDSEPSLVSMLNEDGKWSVCCPVSMLGLDSLIGNKRSRKAQIDAAEQHLQVIDPEKKESVFADAHTRPVDQSAARAKWMADHGIIDDAAIEERIEQQAAQDVAEVVAQAVAVSAIAEAMAPAAETESTPEIVTCEAGESEAQSASTGKTVDYVVHPSYMLALGLAPSCGFSTVEPTIPPSGGNAVDTTTPAGTGEKPSILGQTFEQWLDSSFEANPYKQEYMTAFQGHKNLAMLGACIGNEDRYASRSGLIQAAKTQYFRELMMQPRDAVLSLAVWDSVNSEEKVELQKHFYSLDGQIIRRTQEQCKAKVQQETAPVTPTVAISAEPPAPRPMESTNFAADIPLSLAVSAFGGVSMSPERRGASAQAGYAQDMAQDYETMRIQAVKGGTLDLLPEVFARYRGRQAGAYRAYLASSSRCVSSFIAGPSNFPAARMNKRNDIAHRRLTEYLDGGKMAMQAAIRTLRPDLRAIMAGDADAIDRLAVKIANAERSQERMKEANKAIRTHAKSGHAHQVEALMALGFTETQSIELIKPDFCGRIGFANYQLTNNNANIRRMKERLEQISKAQATEVQSVECVNGVTLEDDAPSNRVRLYFPGKPDEAIRTELKANGFRWAPSIGAWQAYRNRHTLTTAKRLAGEPAPAEDVPEVAEVAPIEAMAPVVESPEVTAPAAEPVPVAEIEATTPAMESQQEPVVPVAGTEYIDTALKFAMSRRFLPDARIDGFLTEADISTTSYGHVHGSEVFENNAFIRIECVGFDNRNGYDIIRASNGKAYVIVTYLDNETEVRKCKWLREHIRVNPAYYIKRMAQTWGTPDTTPDDHAKFNIRAKSGAWFACVYMVGAMYGLRFEAICGPQGCTTYATHAERMQALEAMARATTPPATPPDGGQPIASGDAPTGAPTPPVAQCTPDTPVAVSRAKPEHDLQVGDVVRCSWGYDQTNVNHYQIIALIGKRTVEVRELAEHKESTGDMTGRVAPVWGEFIGEAMRRTVDRHGNVNILREKFGRARKIEPVAVVHGVRCYASTGYSSYA